MAPFNYVLQIKKLVPTKCYVDLDYKVKMYHEIGQDLPLPDVLDLDKTFSHYFSKDSFKQTI